MKKIATTILLLFGIYLAIKIVIATISFISNHILIFTVFIGAIYLITRYRDDCKRAIPFLKNKAFETKKYLKTALSQAEESMDVLLKNLEKKQEHLMVYIREHEQIASELQHKQEEIRKLEKLLDSVKSDKADSGKLQKDLEDKRAELENLKTQYSKAVENVNSANDKLLKLEKTRLQLLDERGKLINQLDELSSALQNNALLNERMQQEITDLKERQHKLEQKLESSISNEEFERIQLELSELVGQRGLLESKVQDLLQAKENLERYRAEIDLVLVTKNEELTNVYNELDMVKENEAKVKGQLGHIRKLLETKEKETQSIRKQILYMEEQSELKMKKAQDQIKHIKMNYEETVAKLMLLENKHQEDINSYNQEIMQMAQENLQLHEQLLRSEEPGQLEAKVLKREFKPRFDKLYPRAEIHERFFQDLIELTTKDRIHVEHEICLMHYSLTKGRIYTIDSIKINCIFIASAKRKRIRKK